METFKLPPEFTQPMMTALGQAWPRPRTRMALAGIETVQKRMAELRMRMDGVHRNGTRKEEKQALWKTMQQEGIAMERELDSLMKKLSKSPATKEQFKRPNVDLSECCDAYTKSEQDGPDNETGYHKVKFTCVECGRVCMAYQRLDREDWEKEYQECLKEEEQEREMELAIRLKQSKSEQPKIRPRLEGNYLI